MPNTVPFTTTEGMRWDTIGNLAYGDPADYSGIIQANPTIPVYDVFAGGVVLQVPVKSILNNVINNNLLPPWMQS